MLMCTCILAKKNVRCSLVTDQWLVPSARARGPKQAFKSSSMRRHPENFWRNHNFLLVLFEPAVRFKAPASVWDFWITAAYIFVTAADDRKKKLSPELNHLFHRGHNLASAIEFSHQFKKAVQVTSFPYTTIFKGVFLLVENEILLKTRKKYFFRKSLRQDIHQRHLNAATVRCRLQ